MELTGAYIRVQWHMWLRYKVTMDDIEITDVPGYWRDREAKMHPGHPLHSCIGCDGPFKATYTFFDSARVGGRFASPTRTWRMIYEHKKERDALKAQTTWNRGMKT